MDDDFKAQIAAAMDEYEPEPGVDWPMALSVAILRTLEARDPGFREAVRKSLIASAEEMEQGDEDDRAAAPDMREMVDSWIFTE